MNKHLVLLVLSIAGIQAQDMAYPTVSATPATDTVVITGAAPVISVGGQVKIGGGHIWAAANASTGYAQSLLYDELGNGYVGLVKRTSGIPGNLALPIG